MTSNEIADIIVSLMIAGAIFMALMICATIQNITDSKTYVTVKDTKNTMRIDTDTFLTFSGYYWDDDGKTLIITYEEADHD